LYDISLSIAGMRYSDYYGLLGLDSNASVDEIKKAYRNKARIYHPDINHSPDAKDKFIQVTEAYEFLIANFESLKSDEEAFRQAMEDWRKYRQDRSRQRAHAYAHASYVQFKATRFYKTTRIFDATRIIFSLILSIIMVLFTVFGYIYRLRNPIPGLENPSVLSFLMLLILSMLFFIVSVIYLKAYQETSKKHRKKS
jgi:hypothetical protein